MKVKEIEAKIGTLSNPSKMPAFGWGISAKHCKTGSKLAKIKGTICHSCYALKGRYVFKNVFNAHEVRRKAIELNEWVDYMAELLTQKYKNLDKSKRYHRWFDAGDIQSFGHLMKIFEVCELTPHIKYWLATREYKIIDQIDVKDVPKNLCLRVSTTKVDSPPPKFWKWTSGVHKNKPAVGNECPAPKQNGECKDCRSCWSRKVKQVSYKEH
tara:strand:- start:5 stop:640 length:636 start_codon:yes stop_codon:yes gene_type:complete